jgi:hypothetical protein
MNQLTDQIPGLAAAIEQERHVRETAFLDLPEVLCGFDVPPLTLAHVIALSVVGNPFIVGGPVAPTDVAAVLISLVQPKGLARWCMLRKLRRINYSESVKAVSEFIAEAFQDAPGGNGVENQIIYYSNAAGIVDLFAREYGWNAHLTLRLPLKQLFQYFKAIQRHDNPKSILFNPSDRVRSEWLVQVNRN